VSHLLIPDETLDQIERAAQRLEMDAGNYVERLDNFHSFLSEMTPTMALILIGELRALRHELTEITVALRLGGDE
jgi:hypothetical protein